MSKIFQFQDQYLWKNVKGQICEQDSKFKHWKLIYLSIFTKIKFF